MNKISAATLSLLMILVVSMILIISTIDRIREFKHNEREIQETVVNGAAFAASMRILETKKLVALFVDEYRDLITRLAIYPNDEATMKKIRDRLHARFSNIFTFTIATPEGVPVLSDIETKVGAVCQKDLSNFIAAVQKGHPVTRENQVSIHPNPSGYHYDVMVPLTISGVSRVFFVSFYPFYLADIARTYAPPGQQLIFVKNDDPTLIEIAAGGSRDMLGRDIHLTAEEAARAKVAKYVAGSKWRLIDLPDERFVKDYEQKLWREVALILIFVGLVSMIMMMYLIRRCRKCPLKHGDH